MKTLSGFGGALGEPRTGGNTEAQRHGEKPGVGESQGRWKARGGGLSSGGELGQWCRAGDVLS